MVLQIDRLYVFIYYLCLVRIFQKTGKRGKPERRKKGILQEAAAVGKVDLVRTLIESGTYVDSIDDCWFKTALQRAVIAGHKDIAALLIDHGARVNYKDSAGFTSLRHAIEGGHTEIVELLIEKGADVNAKNTEGRTPLDIAVMNRQKDVAQLLVDKGAKLSSFLLSFRLASLLAQKDESDRTQEADQD